MGTIIRNVTAARFNATEQIKQVVEFTDLDDTVNKRTAFASRMKKLKGAEAMEDPIVAIAIGKDREDDE